MQRPELLLRVKAAAVALVSFYWYLGFFFVICAHPKKKCGREVFFFVFQVLGEIPKFGRLVVDFLL